MGLLGGPGQAGEQEQKPRKNHRGSARKGKLEQGREVPHTHTCPVSRILTTTLKSPSITQDGPHHGNQRVT